MALISDISPKATFARHAVISRELRTRLVEEARRKEFARNEDKKEKQREEDRSDEPAFDEFASAVVLATDSDIADFTIKLDVYDAATVEALMEKRA